ncbi:hypothetical protein LFYK43_19630 [Ligilactobacillus salitolerans]|uniref:Type VII secretion system protein EssD-like domain-containing protein n=1 Tax=Ligilactobacillus salitolerans TaxID=1808352 RepID=A0A401IVE0_9LACO|nr:hypothetical protein LFYK43_19630 [Ligilactobacillus salitolerans]
MILLGITALTLDFLPNNDQSSPEPARTEKSDNSSLSSSSSSLSSVSRSQNGSRQANSSASSQANENTSQAGLANLSYQGQQVITVNENQPLFSKAELSLAQGSWQRYGNLDRLNRVSQADALLNQDLMPQAERERLYVQPTGWHNKKVNGTWLYNRSHLIDYQLTGQNNNLRNLMTGTRSLNDPGMTTYENQISRYLHQSPSHYVRYSVTPIFPR